jgi:hypothetical protein
MRKGHYEAYCRMVSKPFSPFLVGFQCSCGKLSGAVQKDGLLAGAKSLAIPFEQSAFSKIEPGETMCGVCGKQAKRWTLFGRCY